MDKTLQGPVTAHPTAAAPASASASPPKLLPPMALPDIPEKIKLISRKSIEDVAEVLDF